MDGKLPRRAKGLKEMSSCRPLGRPPVPVTSRFFDGDYLGPGQLLKGMQPQLSSARAKAAKSSGTAPGHPSRNCSDAASQGRSARRGRQAQDAGIRPCQPLSGRDWLSMLNAQSNDAALNEVRILGDAEVAPVMLAEIATPKGGVLVSTG